MDSFTEPTGNASSKYTLVRRGVAGLLQYSLAVTNLAGALTSEGALHMLLQIAATCVLSQPC